MSEVYNGAEPTTQLITSFDGTKIVFDVYDAGSDTIAVVVPGFWRDRKHISMRNLARIALEQGRSAVVIDMRGHGDSTGTYGFNRNEHEDVAAVIRTVLASTAARHVDLVGLSMGGAIAISMAARAAELPLRSLLLISAVSEFGAIAPKLNPFTMHRHIAVGQALRKPRFDWKFRRSAKLKAVEDMTRVHLPSCLLHVRNDWLIAHGHSEALYAAANEPKELHLLDIAGEFHADRIFSVAEEQARSIVIDFWERVNKKAALSRG